MPLRRDPTCISSKTPHARHFLSGHLLTRETTTHRRQDYLSLCIAQTLRLYPESDRHHRKYYIGRILRVAMNGLVITSIRTGAGKTTLALGMAFNRDCAYFKPLGDRVERGHDEDYILLKEYASHVIPPLYRMSDKPPKNEVHARLRKAFEGAQNDCVLIESPRNATFGAYAHLCSADIAATLKFKGIVVACGSSETLIDKVLLARSYFESVGSEIIGVVINKVSYSKMEETENVVIPALERYGLETFGVIPEKKKLLSISGADVLEHLKGRLLAGEKGLESDIDTIVVGAMNFEHALRSFRKSKNKIVITGGDRADIQLAAMETSTSCLVLTGSLYSSPPVLSRADELNIPVIMAKEDTYSVLKKVEEIKSHIRPGDSEKIEIIKNIVGSNVDIEGIMKKI